MKVSIAIPTRDRGVYLASCLAVCTAIDDADLEIVVSDNASTDNTADVVHSFNDPRIRYVRTPGRISQRQNFENAVDHATGDYVITIGDDDSVLPGQFPALKALLERDKPDAVSWQSNFYNWPNAYNPNAGRLKIKKSGVFGKPVTVAAQALLDDPQWGLTHSHDITPRLHHGLISREALDRLRAKTGHIHGSGAVDVYVSSAILTVIDSFVYLRHPFSMLAMGPRSGGLSVQDSEKSPAAGNNSIAIVTQEAAADPVREPIEGHFPVLGFYSLMGMEQANRMAYGGKRPPDYRYHVEQILEQLEKVNDKARDKAIGTLRGFLAEVGARDVLPAGTDSIPRKKAYKGPKTHRQRWPRSYVTPSKVCIDLGGLNLGDVANATLALDHLIGVRASVDEPASWPAVLARSTVFIMQGMIGARPAFHQPQPLDGAASKAS